MEWSFDRTGTAIGASRPVIRGLCVLNIFFLYYIFLYRQLQNSFYVSKLLFIS